jgi:putative toxin-antitoxin system antitoxin component (TIGR02293 family)
MNAAALMDQLYAASGVDRVEKIKKGLPASILPALAKELLISTHDLAVSLGLSPRTLRNRTRKLNVDEAQRGFRAFRVFRRATEVLGNEELAREWMKTPQRALGERRPLDFLSLDVGVEEVLNVLGAVEEGSYL